MYVVYTKAVCYLSRGYQITTEFAQNTQKIKLDQHLRITYVS